MGYCTFQFSPPSHWDGAGSERTAVWCFAVCQVKPQPWDTSGPDQLAQPLQKNQRCSLGVSTCGTIPNRQDVDTLL